ncbi:MAG: FGGY-family carbohydrate kinase [Chitinophagales bacterium]|nr:FGGY-family carbohydrate kinase [Chitinophagales bacterium]
MQYFIGYDVGTSSVKSILIDTNGNLLATAIEEYPLFTPNPGWVEQEPEDYWNAICKATNRIIQSSNISKENIKGIAFSTQAMGVIPVDENGNLLYRNISWVDGRAEEQAVKAMKYFGGKRIFKLIAGIELTGKDVIPKIIWLKDKHPEIYKKTHKILDVNGYLKYKCSGKMVAEWSGACSYAFDVKKKDWERLFFKLCKIDLTKLPDLVRSIDLVGNLTPEAAFQLGLTQNTCVFGGCDDTQSAAVGTTAIGEGEAHIYVGTSAWVGVTTSKNLKFKNAAVCLQSADPKKNIVVGITESAGINTQWVVDTYYQNEKEKLSEQDLFSLIEKEINNTNAGADYLLMTPWFLGERCPISTTTTRSTLFNLTHQHTRGHIARANFEGIGFNLKWTIDNLEKDYGFRFDTLKITGGGSKNKSWMQLIADITNRKIITTSQPVNAGAFGAAMCAMVGSGTFKDFSEINKLIQCVDTFIPNPKHTKIYNELFNIYKSVFHQLNKTYQQINKARFES